VVGPGPAGPGDRLMSQGHESQFGTELGQGETDTQPRVGLAGTPMAGHIHRWVWMQWVGSRHTGPSPHWCGRSSELLWGPRSCYCSHCHFGQQMCGREGGKECLWSLASQKLAPHACLCRLQIETTGNVAKYQVLWGHLGQLWGGLEPGVKAGLE
jgi:hypothetical protein